MEVHEAKRDVGVRFIGDIQIIEGSSEREPVPDFLDRIGIEPQDERSDVHTASEIGMIISESAKGGLLDRFEHRLLAGAASFGERDAGSAMVPRTELVAVPAEISSTDMEGVVVASGHTRIPVYENDLDHILGFFHSKDLLKIDPSRYEDPIPRAFIRPMLVVPESLHLHPLSFISGTYYVVTPKGCPGR